MISLKIKDETATGKLLNEIELAFKNERIKVKDLIAKRVETEVATFNSNQPQLFNGLVQPKRAEETLNGYKMKKGDQIDAEQQVYLALEAFNTNGFFVLIDDKQVEQLEQEVLVSSETAVSFVKLTPMVGG